MHWLFSVFFSVSSVFSVVHFLKHPPSAGLAGHRRAGHHEFARCDLALAERGGATGAEVVVDFLVGQDEQELFADRHGGLAFFAIERRGAETFELLHGGVCAAEDTFAARGNQPHSGFVLASAAADWFLEPFL